MRRVRPVLWVLEEARGLEGSHVVAGGAGRVVKPELRAPSADAHMMEGLPLPDPRAPCQTGLLCPLLDQTSPAPVTNLELG